MQAAMRVHGGAAPRKTKVSSTAVFTVHDRSDGSAYSLRHHRLAVVVFRCHQEAYTVSRALDYHRKVHGDFPSNNLEDNPRALESLQAAPLCHREPLGLSTRRWESLEQLAQTCQQNALDILFCREVFLRPHISYSGDVFELAHAEYDEVVAMLERKVCE
jgi:hypothetical protein